MRSCLLLLATAALALAADLELSLADGRTVRGEMVSESDAEIVLRSRFHTRGVIKQIESKYVKADVLKRKEIASPAQQYEERKARTPDTVPEQCTLAQWAHENCLREQARTHALRVLELDAENAWAKRILDNCGYLEIDGKWVDEAEYLKANNLVRMDGQLVPAGLAEARRAYTRARSAYETAKRKLEEARETASGKAGSAASAEAKAKEAAAQAETLKKSIDEATAALAKAKEEPAGGGGEARKERQAAIEAATKRIAELRDQQNEARRNAESAKRTGTSDKSAAERAKGQIAELETAMAKAEAEMKAAAAKLPADDPVLRQTEVADKPKAEDKPKEPEKPKGEDKPKEPEKPQVRRLRSGGGD